MANKIFGYARVSSKDQNLDRQIAELKKYKASEIITDKASGKGFDRTGLNELHSKLRKGDTLIIKELDRLGRNKQGIKQELEYLRAEGVKVVILNIPTTLILLDENQSNSSIMDMINNILIEVLSTIAQEEVEKINQRQKEGIKQAKEKGIELGRPKEKITDRKIKLIEQILKGERSKISVAKELDTSRMQLDRLIKRYQEEKGGE